jgi:hypothetical protein
VRVQAQAKSLYLSFFLLGGGGGRGSGVHVLEKDLCKKSAKAVEKILKTMIVGAFSNRT